MKGRNKRKKQVDKIDLEQALIKKALGYDATEVVEEYVGDGEEIKLSKKKVTTKNVPPDMSALKFLLDETQKDASEMTDQELYEEKVRLLCLLKEIQNS
ncbi:MAG: hypothetical protein E7372_04650 [Clostridiales bacterium]|nr:hypothetical protein [Clostridiales bacterium]